MSFQLLVRSSEEHFKHFQFNRRGIYGEFIILGLSGVESIECGSIGLVITPLLHSFDHLGKIMNRITLSFFVISILFGTAHSLNSTFFKQKLANFSLTEKQIEEIANKFNNAAKPQQTIANLVKKLPKKNRSEIKGVLLEMNSANNYIDKMFEESIEEAKKVVNSTLIDKFESLKSSHDDAFKQNFAVAQSSLLKAASAILDNSTFTQLGNAINSPLAKIGNDTKGLQKLKSYITFFQG